MTKLNGGGTKVQAPVITIQGHTLPAVWELAVVRTWMEGVEVPTEYHGQSSKDCTMIMVVETPWLEPRVHRCFHDSPEGLLKYVDSIAYRRASKDIDKLSYTYGDRLTNYPNVTDELLSGIDQLQYIRNKLMRTPHSRRAQGITWIPGIDTKEEYNPCLQRIWYRVVDGALDMHTHWRSRDAYRAAFANMYAMAELQNLLAQALMVDVGQYVDISNSFHIYDVCYDQVDGFVKRRSGSLLRSRTWTTAELLDLANQ